MAWSDRPWILEGAAVRVSMIGFDSGDQSVRTLDGVNVTVINADLTSTADLSVARPLAENLDLCLIGDQKGGTFNLPPDVASSMLSAPLNPNGRPNSDVVRPWVNGMDVVRRPRGMWIVDFGVDMPEESASLYEIPFEHVLRHVKPQRATNNRAAYRDRWWLHHEPRPKLRSLLAPLDRFIVTPMVARHRLFVWVNQPTLPDKRLIVIARDDDYFFGVLHSRVHEAWSLATSSRHGVGNDPVYIDALCFEAFPFPWPPGQEPADDPRVVAIAEAASRLDQLRTNWLNPPDASAADLKKRTLTNLYNQRPHWLELAHKKLDDAVADAYGWPHDLPDAEILERLLALNLARSPA